MYCLFQGSAFQGCAARQRFIGNTLAFEHGMGRFPVLFHLDSGVFPSGLFFPGGIQFPAFFLYALPGIRQLAVMRCFAGDYGDLFPSRGQ